MMVPFRPPVSAQQPGGSQILDRLMGAVRRTFDSLSAAFVANPETGSTGQALILGPDGIAMWSPYAGSTTTGEQATTDVAPSVQESDTLATATTHVTTIPLLASRHYWVTAVATAWDSAEAVVYTTTLFIRASVTHAGAASHLTPDTTTHTAGAGFTFTSSVSGSDLVLSLANASGSTRAIQVVAQLNSARTRF